jgi:hypothetical protein
MSMRYSSQMFLSVLFVTVLCSVRSGVSMSVVSFVRVFEGVPKTLAPSFRHLRTLAIG